MEQKSFASYIAENKKEYNYILKFAVDEMTDNMIDTLESCLTKYDLKKASSFRKTPIQESPLDFPNIKNSPVFICDLTLGYPGSLDFLRTFICNGLGISPAQLAVYSSNDPRTIETDLFLDRNSPEFREKYKTQLDSDYEETGDKDLYGEKYNVTFLQELEKVRKERQVNIVTNSLIPEETTNHSTLPKGYHEFNSDKNLNKDDVGFFGRIKRPNLTRAGTL